MPGGKRVLAGWLIAPLVAFVFWGSWSILVVPVIYLVMLLIGLPVLRYCYGRGWLQWWYALIAGCLAGLPVAAFYYVSTDAYHVELAGPRIFLILQSYGAVVGFLFWWIAVFRNPKFPQRSTNWPLLVISVALLSYIAWSAISRFEITKVFGKIAGMPSSRQVSLGLADGTVVEARYPDEARPRTGESREVGAYSRLPMLSDKRLYWLNGMCREQRRGELQVVPCDIDDVRKYAPPPP